LRKKILITGGTGSLGKALIKKIKGLGWKIIVYSRDEGKQALAFGSDPDIIRVIGDVRDLTKIDTTMRLHKPDFVIHAAALKRVDDMEFHPDECIKTNVMGSQNVATAALANDVKKCMLISTDKACQPINVYGSSKFIAERIFTNFDYNSSSTIFASVRYGNVIASRGSFIPLWMDKVRNKEQIPITSFDCSRFLFTLDDAVDTVLLALETAQGGEVFIPKISSYKLETVLNAVLEMTGVENADTVVNGMRPGEKIHEDMLAKTELPFTYEVDETLMVVTPQYTNKEHTYNKRYEGLEYNSSLHLDNDVSSLRKIIEVGVGIEG
jgi:FlaA1/EpsC-like NDP-sugar epimerase|tara:strand:+ start:4947 stop:5918 length:972 start_codon:yes stop_codon:yes gene_type:complete